MKCKKKGCNGFVTLGWSPDDIKDGLFIIDGECELCHAKYAVAMQLFEKSKFKNGARLFGDLQVIEKCRDCMLCLSSDNRSRNFFCDVVAKSIKDPNKIPKWCRLPRLDGEKE